MLIQGCQYGQRPKYQTLSSPSAAEPVYNERNEFHILGLCKGNRLQKKKEAGKMIFYLHKCHVTKLILCARLTTTYFWITSSKLKHL